MKTSRSLIALTAINFVLLLFAVAQQLHPAFAQAEPSVLRGRALEIVDGQGRVRASINVLPPGKSSNGEETHETVLLRLNTERGRPSVKIGSSEPVSGLSFAGPTGTKDTYVILQAKGIATSLKLRNEMAANKSLNRTSAAQMPPKAFERTHTGGAGVWVFRVSGAPARAG